MKSDVEIAQEAEPKPTVEVAKDFALSEADIDFCANYRAKVHLDVYNRLKQRPAGGLPLYAAVSPRHGGGSLDELRAEILQVLEKGLENLKKHVGNMHLYGVPVTVVIDRFPDDTEAGIRPLEEKVQAIGSWVVPAEVCAKGGEGGIDPAQDVFSVCDGSGKPDFWFLYDLDGPIEKTESSGTRIYDADGVICTSEADEAIDRHTQLGYEGPPVCMAKTRATPSDDKNLVGRSGNWHPTLQEAGWSAGAGCVLPVCGKLMTMPGLPKHPAAENIDLVNGKIVGLS